MAALGQLDTVRALEDSGADRRLAETLARLISDAAATPPLSELATKEDIERFATKQDLRQESAEIKAYVSEKLQSLQVQYIAIVAALVAAATAIIKLTP